LNPQWPHPNFLSVIWGWGRFSSPCGVVAVPNPRPFGLRESLGSLPRAPFLTFCVTHRCWLEHPNRCCFSSPRVLQLVYPPPLFYVWLVKLHFLKPFLLFLGLPYFVESFSPPISPKCIPLSLHPFSFFFNVTWSDYTILLHWHSLTPRPKAPLFTLNPLLFHSLQHFSHDLFSFLCLLTFPPKRRPLPSIIVFFILSSRSQFPPSLPPLPPPPPFHSATLFLLFCIDFHMTHIFGWSYVWFLCPAGSLSCYSPEFFVLCVPPSLSGVFFTFFLFLPPS